MEDAETKALKAAMDYFVSSFDEEHRFTAADIRGMHKGWLGEIYEWAGDYRQVNLSKDGFVFAAAMRIPALMLEYGRRVLADCTPCRFKSRYKVISALAKTHAEHVLIHPFREGNGRIARVLSTLMALQAGLPLLDFSGIAGSKKLDYFAAVQEGMDHNYERMERLFSEIIDRSLSAS